jgi:hypothetical protein
MRRRKRRSEASYPETWEPTRDLNTKLELDNDTTFGWYSKMDAGTPVHQPSKAELYSEGVPSPSTTGSPKLAKYSSTMSKSHPQYCYLSARPEQHINNMESRYTNLGDSGKDAMTTPASPHRLCKVVIHHPARLRPRSTMPNSMVTRCLFPCPSLVPMLSNRTDKDCVERRLDVCRHLM